MPGLQDPTIERSDDIKTMKLYTHLDRFEDEMRARNLLDGKISEKDLSSFDMMHYYGVESVKEAAISLDLDKRQRILGLVSEKQALENQLPFTWYIHILGKYNSNWIFLFQVGNTSKFYLIFLTTILALVIFLTSL